jgi:hypothetical protein
MIISFFTSMAEDQATAIDLDIQIIDSSIRMYFTCPRSSTHVIRDSIAVLANAHLSGFGFATDIVHPSGIIGFEPSGKHKPFSQILIES